MIRRTVTIDGRTVVVASAALLSELKQAIADAAQKARIVELPAAGARANSLSVLVTANSTVVFEEREVPDDSAGDAHFAIPDIDYDV